ncbi:MAG: protein kinase [Acidobacteria bacterium]|nr:protein kinase [Acidobacteriota bacterium]
MDGRDRVTEAISPEERTRLVSGPDVSFPAPLSHLFRVEARIGRGALGAVYRARAAGSDRAVAVKICARPDRDSFERMRREFVALSRIDHEAVARAIDFKEVDGRACLVSEYVAGSNLEEHVARRGKLPAREALDLFRQLLGALEAVHREGIVHRDVKPANIVIRSVAEGDRLVLVDFGLARMEGTSSLTGTGDIVGTPAYMAPEQLSNAREVDARADLYAATAVLFFMIEGRAPYEGSTAFDLWSAHRVAPIPRLTEGSRIERNVAGSLIRTGMRKAPSRRWATANEASRAVRVSAARLRSPRGVDRVAAWTRAVVVEPLADALRGAVSRRVAAWGLAVAGILAVTGMSIALLSTPAVVRAEVHANHLVAFDAGGRELWSFDAGGAVRPDAYVDPTTGLIQIADLTGDGVEEVLFGASQAEPSEAASFLYCLDRRGRLVWRQPAGGRTIEKRGDFRESAFTVARVLVLPADPSGRRDVVMVSNARTWSASQVRSIAPDGTTIGEWWHHGAGSALLATDLNGDGRPELLYGAFDNASRGAGLVVLDPHHLEGAGPPDERGASPFAGLARGTEWADVRFPRRDVDVAADETTSVGFIEPKPDGTFRVRVGNAGCETFYDLGRSLRAVDSYAADSCAATHRRWQSAGRLNHAFGPGDPELLPKPQYWNGSAWTPEAAFAHPTVGVGTPGVP